MNNCVDVHYLTRLEAKQQIIDTIINCYKANIRVVKVIHGFNNGTSIRDWLRNSKDILNMDEVKEIISIHPGETLIQLNNKLK